MLPIVCHVVAPAHTRPDMRTSSICPFTCRTISLVSALRRAGAKVIEYANEGSVARPDEHVTVLTEEERISLFATGETMRPPPDGHVLYETFYGKLLRNLEDRIDTLRLNILMYALPIDARIIPIPRGTKLVEPGVGYDIPPWGAARVYESQAWRHYMFGKYPSSVEDRQRSGVIPWAFDENEWSLGKGHGNYVAYLGRLAPDKGLRSMADVAKMMPETKFKIAGPGPRFIEWPRNVEFLGTLRGSERAMFLQNAKVNLCLSDYVEPFNGAAVEAMLCGTPVVSSDFGGFTETVIEGQTGYRAHSPADAVKLIAHAAKLDRNHCREITIGRFGIDAVARKWERYLERISSW
jgi:glycosyltransferase involved in cell wall biosynthesis